MVEVQISGLGPVIARWPELSWSGLRTLRAGGRGQLRGVTISAQRSSPRLAKIMGRSSSTLLRIPAVIRNMPKLIGILF